MIGIYKIQNKLNNKVYIGQSNDIERRFKEHCSYKRNKNSNKHTIDRAICKYGKESFTYEIIEECPLEKLDEREIYWIQYYNSYEKGYNCTKGGQQNSIGEHNGRAKLTEADVIIIRTAYQNHEKQKDVYEQFKNKISWGTFQGVWQGKTWKYIMPEVLTEENKNYYIYQNSIGTKSAASKLTNEEIKNFRYRYQFETAKDMYPEVQDRITYQTFQRILCGTHNVYSDIPLYEKAPKYILSDEEVKESRIYYCKHSAKQTYNHFEFAKNIPFSTFKQMLEGLRYKHLPWYSKKYRKWIQPE